MRVAVEKTDPGYRVDSYRYRAFLNGQFVEKCIMADEEAGQVSFLATDATGRLVIAADGESVEIKTLFGKVKIEKLSS